MTLFTGVLVHAAILGAGKALTAAREHEPGREIPGVYAGIGYAASEPLSLRFVAVALHDVTRARVSALGTC